MENLEKLKTEQRDGAGKGGEVITPLTCGFDSNMPCYDICCDYLSFTFPCKLFQDFMGSDTNKELLNHVLTSLKLDLRDGAFNKGRYGYPFGHQWNVNMFSGKDVGTFLNYGPSDSTKLKDGTYTTMFELSGSACRALEQRFNHDPDCWPTLFNSLKNVCARPTRFDLAIDFYNLSFDLCKFLRNKIKNGLLITPFKKNQEVVDGEREYEAGHTVYIGTKKSLVFIRVYDKLAESKGISTDFSSWYRIEFQCRGEKAVDMFKQFVTNYSDLYVWASKLLNYYIQPKVDDGDDRVRDRETDPEWLELLQIQNPMDKARLKPVTLIKDDLQKTMQWFERDMPGIFAWFAISMGYPNFIEYVEKIMCEGLYRDDLKPNTKRYRAAERYRENNRLPELTATEIQQMKDLLNLQIAKNSETVNV